MLEDYFTVPEAAMRLRSCLLGAHLDEFCPLLTDLGYKDSTIRHKLWELSTLARWMSNKHLTVGDLDERNVDEFLKIRRRRGRTCRGFRSTAFLLIEQLRSTGVIPTPEVSRDDSPEAALLKDYEMYLRQERALVESTVSGYLISVREFVFASLHGDTMRPDTLGPGDVRAFLLARIRSVAPRYAQHIRSALRSFLRFLFLRGETNTDLSLAVPTVRQWRHSTVPRHMSTEEVERILGACDLTSATGRRNHAILLLLARLGLRAGEVIALELDDLNWRTGEIMVRGKGLICDRLPLLPDVGEALALYLKKDRPSCRSRRVFICRHAPHRGFGHPSTVSTIVMRALARAGLSPAVQGAHLLRHSLATTMVRRGASLSEIGQVLRHRSPNTTEIYAKLDFETLRDVAMPWPTTGGAR